MNAAVISKNVNNLTPINPLLFNTIDLEYFVNYPSFIEFKMNPINFIDPFGLCSESLTLKEALGNDAGILGSSIDTFNGVVGQGGYVSGGAFFGVVREEGTAYVAENGVVTESFNYTSKSFGGMTNYGGEAGFALTVISDAKKEDFLGSSTTTGGSGGFSGLSAGASWVKTSTGLDGYTVTKGVGWSQLPVTVSAYHDNVTEK